MVNNTLQVNLITFHSLVAPPAPSVTSFQILYSQKKEKNKLEPNQSKTTQRAVLCVGDDLWQQSWTLSVDADMLFSLQLPLQQQQ